MNITMAMWQNVELDHVTYYYNVSWHIICMEYAICFYFRPFNQLNVNVDKSSNLSCNAIWSFHKHNKIHIILRYAKMVAIIIVERWRLSWLAELGEVVRGSALPRSWRGTKGAASTLPELPTARTGLTLSPITLLNVVYLVVVGFWVVVLGPFLDKITSSQFHFGSISWALAYGHVLPYDSLMNPTNSVKTNMVLKDIWQILRSIFHIQILFTTQQSNPLNYNFISKLDSQNKTCENVILL